MTQFFSSLLLLIAAFCTLHAHPMHGKVKVGSELLMSDEYADKLKGKRIGLITNQTAVNGRLQSTIEILKANQAEKKYTLAALFAPEHGLTGSLYAFEEVLEAVDEDGIPIYSLHGKTQRPTDQMLKNIQLLIYDIQDIGSRSYTFVTTLFYVMEEAAKKGIPVMVLDRPNPINGIVVDGPMMEEQWRSFVGYINVPYCHGMTIGELARLFNEEYKVGCRLEVVPMLGWRRWMTFNDTGLPWMPTSPHVPEASTAFFYPVTGILGELQIANIGVGYTLPFKLVGAPWIDANEFAQRLNSQKYPGVYFEPFYWKPFYGRYAQEECQGVLIVITDPIKYKPVCTQYLLIGMIKSLYPKKFAEALNAAKARKEMFCKVNGTDEVYRIMMEPKPIAWKLRALHEKERGVFLDVRKKYLLPEYD